MCHLHHHRDTAAISSTLENSTSTLPHGFTMASTPHSHANRDTEHMSMHTTFYFGYKNVELLFPGLVIQCRIGMLLAFLVMFCLALCYEGLKVAQEKLTDRAKISPRPHVLRWLHLAQTALHVLQVVLSYVLMLTFMTYNAYFTLAVLAGASTGYLVFCLKILVSWSQLQQILATNLEVSLWFWKDPEDSSNRTGLLSLSTLLTSFCPFLPAVNLISRTIFVLSCVC